MAVKKLHVEKYDRWNKESHNPTVPDSGHVEHLLSLPVCMTDSIDEEYANHIGSTTFHMRCSGPARQQC